MNVAKIEVSGVRAVTRGHVVIPAGITGATVCFVFTDPRWDDLTKIAVFQGSQTRDVAMDSDCVVIPHETVAQPGRMLRVGVCGIDRERNLVIPTLWTTVGPIQDGADPSGDSSVEPTLPVWAQLAQRLDEVETMVGQMTLLSDDAKRYLLAIMRAGLYASDQSANISRLEALLEITPAMAENSAALGAARLGILGLNIPYQT